MHLSLIDGTKRHVTYKIYINVKIEVKTWQMPILHVSGAVL